MPSQNQSGSLSRLRLAKGGTASDEDGAGGRLEKENGRWGGMMCGRCADNHESAVQHKPLRWGGLP